MKQEISQYQVSYNNKNTKVVTDNSSQIIGNKDTPYGNENLSITKGYFGYAHKMLKYFDNQNFNKNRYKGTISPHNILSAFTINNPLKAISNITPQINKKLSNSRQKQTHNSKFSNNNVMNTSKNKKTTPKNSFYIVEKSESSYIKNNKDSWRKLYDEDKSVEEEKNEESSIASEKIFLKNQVTNKTLKKREDLEKYQIRKINREFLDQQRKLMFDEFNNTNIIDIVGNKTTNEFMRNKLDKNKKIFTKEGIYNYLDQIKNINNTEGRITNDNSQENTSCKASQGNFNVNINNSNKYHETSNTLPYKHIANERTRYTSMFDSDQFKLNQNRKTTKLSSVYSTKSINDIHRLNTYEGEKKNKINERNEHRNTSDKLPSLPGIKYSTKNYLSIKPKRAKRNKKKENLNESNSSLLNSSLTKMINLIKDLQHAQMEIESNNN